SGASESFALNIGGGGGIGATSGLVNVSNSGTIATFGDSSDGIFAQSVGGGGGAAGSVESKSKAPSDASIARNGTRYVGALNIGASGGDGAVGGAVSVSNSGLIQTGGIGAYGIRAQSVGGGGGKASSVVSTDPLASGNSVNVSLNL